MKTKSTEPTLDAFIHSRCTKEDKQYIKKQADKLGMPVNTYIRDKLTDGKERTAYGKRKLCTSMVKLTNHVDELYGILAEIDMPVETREKLEECVNAINEERGTIWNY